MHSILMATLLLLCSGSVFAVTLDFEEPGIDYGAPGSISGYFNGPVITRGFQISYNCPSEPCDNIFVDSTLPGPTHTLAWRPYSSITIEALNLVPFDLLSMDLTTAYGGNYSVLGHYAAGGTIQVDLFASEPFVLSNVAFDLSWQGLASIEIAMPDGPGIVDNIVISQVPLPAAVWLFGSALAGLGWIKRNQIV